MVQQTLMTIMGEEKPPSDIRRVRVLLPLPFSGPFDYAVPAALPTPQPGDLVRVPLGRREETGVVWDEASKLPPEFSQPASRSVADARLRPIVANLGGVPVPADLRRFVDWVAAYTLSAPGLVLAMALRARSDAPRAVTQGWVMAEAPPQDVRMTPARTRVLDALRATAPQSGPDLARTADVGMSVLRGLEAAGVISPVTMPAETDFPAPNPEHQPPILSGDQVDAAHALRSAVTEHRFSVTLLEGVTGSGKTEIYLEAVAACLAAGKQALILLPEIALSAQWTARFERRFGVAPAIWHSDLTPRMRRTTWRAVSDGEVKVLVGARSALFLPFPDLGLIIVDEEHETAFKQEDGVTYHARDMAVVRARLAHAPIILVSATPSLETLNNVETGRYGRIVLSARHGGAVMPEVQAIDMRVDPPERGLFLSPRLVDALHATFAQSEQAMLFLNRRGYAPLTLCRGCGHRMECPNCAAWLVEHRARKILTCHHCGHMEKVPETCPACQAEASLTAIGPGVERITEEARATFPEARILVMTSDTLTSPGATAQAVAQISNREVDLIIGTQIVAKGWHFPHLTLAGIVDADLGLGGGDLRAAERSVQLLHQVAGRTGRAQAPGRVLLQSYIPEHPVMQALVSGNFAEFMEREADQRRPGFWPPYGRLAALIVSADTADAADEMANALGRCAPSFEGVQVLGPAPAPLSLLRGRHRRRLLLRGRRNIALQPIVRQWLGFVKITGSVRVDVDIDPISFL